MNIGFEANLGGKLDLSFDYFHNRRSSILCLPNRSIPSYMGAELPYLNIGKTKNTGFEASITYHDRIGKDFEYYLKTDMWMAKNEILYMSEDIRAENNGHLYKTGHRINQPFYLESLGYYTNVHYSRP